MSRLNWQRPSLRYKDNLARTMRLLERYDAVRPESDRIEDGYKGLNGTDFAVISDMLEAFSDYLDAYSHFLSGFMGKKRASRQKTLDAKRATASGAVRTFIFLWLQDSIRLGHPKRAHSNFVRHLQRDLKGNIALEMIDALFHEEFQNAGKTLIRSGANLSPA